MPWGLYWGPLVLGNYHIHIYSQQERLWPQIRTLPTPLTLQYCNPNRPDISRYSRRDFLLLGGARDLSNWLNHYYHVLVMGFDLLGSGLPNPLEAIRNS